MGLWAWLWGYELGWESCGLGLGVEYMVDEGGLDGAGLGEDGLWKWGLEIRFCVDVNGGTCVT